MSPRSIFPTAQRFSFPKHVTSGSMSPRSIFPTAQRFSFPKHVTSGSMSPRSIFPTAQRFSIPKHVTSGCMSPRSIFPTSQRFPIPLPVMTSIDQSEARIRTQTGPHYYLGDIIFLFYLCCAIFCYSISKLHVKVLETKRIRLS